jgi:hypothetical protein
MTFKVIFTEPTTIGKKVYAPGTALEDCDGNTIVFRTHDAAWVTGKWAMYDQEGVPMRAMQVVKER